MDGTSALAVLVAAARELDMLSVQLTKLLDARNGEPYAYWRMGTS